MSILVILEVFGSVFYYFRVFESISAILGFLVLYHSV